MYVDEFVDKMLHDQVFMGIALPFLQKRMALEQQGAIQPRISMLEQEEDEQPGDEDQKAI